MFDIDKSFLTRWDNVSHLALELPDVLTALVAVTASCSFLITCLS
jgi:hypothetical protein